MAHVASVQAGGPAVERATQATIMACNDNNTSVNVCGVLSITAITVSSFDESRLSARRPPTVKPNQQNLAESSSTSPLSPSPFIIVSHAES